MATLRMRVDELERDPMRSRVTRDSPDEVLFAFLGFAPGYAPTDAELEGIAAGQGAPNITEGARHGRTD